MSTEADADSPVPIGDTPPRKGGHVRRKKSASKAGGKMRLVSLLVLAGTLAVAISSAQAASSDDAPYTAKVSITSAVDGPFRATGRSLCPSGQVATTYNFFLGSVADGFNLVVGKSFTCDDGSGTFDLVLYVEVRPGVRRNDFRWLITHGTGRYEGLHGAGTGVGDYSDPPIDHYTGRVR